MRTRIEILKGDTWVELVLKEKSIKYNQVCNRIGSLDQRKISHSNTFPLPYVSENIIALNINVFSPVLMAEALNRKFQARYYVKDKLLQKGYLVINNTIRGEISVNFIDEALVIVDEWGRLTFKQLLQKLINTPLELNKSVISPSFLANLTILSSYNLDKTVKVLNTPSCFCNGDDLSIEDKEVFITRFPNYLNNIGDKFQLDKEDIRKVDFFNPFQSRPIFSMFGFLYIVSQAFGYKLRLDPGVDFLALRDTYLCNNGTKEGTPQEDSFVSSSTKIIASGEAQYWRTNKGGAGSGDNEGWFEMFFQYPDDVPTINEFGKKVGVASRTPNEVGSYPPSHTYYRERESILDKKCVVLIETNPIVGQVVWTGEISPRVPLNKFSFSQFIAVSVWRNIYGSTTEIPFIIESEGKVSEGSNPDRTFIVKGEKSQLNDIPPGFPTFIGLVLRVIVRHEDEFYNDVPSIKNMHFVEKVLPKGLAEFDKFGQYLNSTVDLLSLAPETSIKELLSSILQQQGLLLTFVKDENGVQNIVKLFTYGAYRDRVRESREGQLNKFYDWSEYHQRNIDPGYNTDFGSEYGEMNEVSLTNPFPGNIGHIKISTNVTSKGFQSKLIPLAKNQAKSFEDVSAVDFIGDTDPYFEYTNTSLGLVSCKFNEFLPGSRKQYNAELTGFTAIADELAKISNVVYSDDYLPIGIKELYYLVDVSVKSTATFLLPTFVVQNFDISLPVYVESLGGFYIVEQIGEYVDDLTLVKVDLIKLPLSGRDSQSGLLVANPGQLFVSFLEQTLTVTVVNLFSGSVELDDNSWVTVTIEGSNVLFNFSQNSTLNDRINRAVITSITGQMIEIQIIQYYNELQTFGREWQPVQPFCVQN